MKETRIRGLFSFSWMVENQFGTDFAPNSDNLWSHMSHMRLILKRKNSVLGRTFAGGTADQP
jgi:hypothetical protein